MRALEGVALMDRLCNCSRAYRRRQSSGPPCRVCDCSACYAFVSAAVDPPEGMVIVTAIVISSARFGAATVTSSCSLLWCRFWPSLDGQRGTLRHTLNNIAVDQLVAFNVLQFVRALSPYLGQRLCHRVSCAVPDPVVEAVVVVLCRGGARAVCTGLLNSGGSSVITCQSVHAPPQIGIDG